MASSQENKRQRLAYNQFKFDKNMILGYTRLSHTNFIDWKYNLLYKIK